MTAKLKPAIEKQIIKDYRRGIRFMQIVSKFSIGTTTLARVLKRNRIRPKGHPRLLTNKEVVKALYDGGMSCREVGFQLGVSEFVVRHSLKRFWKVKLRRTGNQPGYFTDGVRKKMSKAIRKRWDDPDYRKRMLKITLRNGFSHGKKKKTTKSVRDPADELRYEVLRKRVLTRDNNHCRKCFKKLVRAHMHHVYPWKEFPQYRYDEWNVVALCPSCHMSIEAKIKHGQEDYFRNTLSVVVP